MNKKKDRIISDVIEKHEIQCVYDPHWGGDEYFYNDVYYEYRYYGSSFVDMQSFYSKGILRQKRIDQILGINTIPKIPTFADIVEIATNY
jgi:hypothetical protein